MKRKIIAAVLVALLTFLQAPAWAEDAGAAEVTAVNGAVTVSCRLDVPEKTPVLIAVLQAVMDADGQDVTLERVNGLTSKEALLALRPEYVAIEKTGADGLLVHSCQMKSSLPTGLCHVIISYIGSASCRLAGSFEHVGKDDLDALVQSFNAATAAEYDGIIKRDINGDAEAVPPIEAKDILRKSSADTAYYQTLQDTTAFCALLQDLKPAEGFTISILITAFNEACAWIRLRSETDTLTVLQNGNGKYWNLSLNNDSDFAKLTADEQKTLLLAVKNGQYTKADALEKDFTDGVVLGMFRGEETREGLAALIAEKSVYADCFSSVRALLANAELSDYLLASVYNKVLAERASCRSLADVEALFKRSLPKTGGTSGGSSSGSGGGSKVGASSGFSVKSGTGSTSKPNEAAFPFADVADNSWSRPYIEQLYKSGTVNGIGEGVFAPNAPVSRQDFVKILIGVLNIAPSQNPSVFEDVVGSYSEPFVTAAYEKGLVSGIGDTLFGAKNSITREDAAMILQRVLHEYGRESNGAEETFADMDAAAAYARDSILALSGFGILRGDDEGFYRPKAELSRAEACAVLCRLADTIKGE